MAAANGAFNSLVWGNYETDSCFCVDDSNRDVRWCAEERGAGQGSPQQRLAGYPAGTAEEHACRRGSDACGKIQLQTHRRTEDIRPTGGAHDRSELSP